MGKLRQASPVKFYLAKYFFLGFGLLQLTVATILLSQSGSSSKSIPAAVIFIALGSLSLVTFVFITERVKRVAVGKDKIVVIGGKKNKRFKWPEVESINLVPFFNLYRLYLKDQKLPIYFFPSRNIDPAYDLLARDTSKMGDIVNKRKKELGI